MIKMGGTVSLEMIMMMALLGDAPVTNGTLQDENTRNNV